MPHRSRFVALVGFTVALLVVALCGTGRRAAAQPKAPAITAAPQAPTLTTPANFGARPGAEIELTLTGTNLAGPTAVLLSCPAKVTIPTDKKNGTEAGKLRVKVALDAACPIGLHTIRVATRNGVSNARPFVVDSLPAIASAANNRTKDAAQPVSVPCVVSGTVASETSEFFKLKVGANQKLTFEVLARRIGSALDPIIVLHDARTNRELIELYADDTPGLQGDCRLTHVFKEAGEILVEVRDTTHRGGGDYTYRLRVGEFPGATTAFPLAIQRGKTTSIGFTGPYAIPAVKSTAPNDLALAAFYVVPTAGKSDGWPLPVLLSDHPETAEVEPNDAPAKANKLPVPGGVSARFEKAKDIDHFAIRGKKGQKLAVAVQTYQVNSPAEVLVRVLDAKGAQVAASNPAAAVNRFEFTPAADGEYVLACEHQNFLHGPNEVYHLSVVPVAPDFAVSMSFDRGEAPAGSGTGVLCTVARQGGFAGPVELTIDGGPTLSGTITLPAGQTFAFVPVMVKAGAKPGAYPFRVKATAKTGDATITHFAQLLDSVKASLGGIPNPPPEMLNHCVLGVTEKPAFTITLTVEPEKIEQGKAGKILLKASREKDAPGDIAIAPLLLPANVTAAVKPLPKGQTKGEFPLNVTAKAATGPASLSFKATTKVGGKDYVLIAPPLAIEVTKPTPKKTEPKKKDAPKKKDEPKKKGKK